MNLSFFIAKRYLLSKKSTNAINIISGISVFVICIVTAATIIVLSGLNGLTDLVESLYNSFNPDIEITIKEGKVFDAADPKIVQIQQLPGVHYFAESLEENVLLKYNDQQCRAILKGVSESFIPLTRLDTLVREGNHSLFEQGRPQAIIGGGLSMWLNLNIQDMFSGLTVYAPKRGQLDQLNPDDAFAQQNIRVGGIFAINDEFNYQYVLVPISFSRQLLDYKTEVSSIELGLDSTADKSAIQQHIKDLLGSRFVVKNRFQQNEALFKTLQSEKLITFIVLVFILVIATFNIIASLTMLIVEKKKDISTLRYIGANNAMIKRIFLYEGMLLTFSGAIMGILLGLLFCWLQIHFQLLKFGSDGGYIVEAYPVKIEWKDILYVLCSVMVIGCSAAWLRIRGLKFEE